MESRWLSNEGAKKRVKDLLEQAGVPLELEVANVCKAFCQSHGVGEQTHITAERIVYSPSPDEAQYREIDQRVDMYEEFELDELTGVQLIINLPIECKYRTDIEVFGFPAMSGDDAYKGFPIHGKFAGSTLFRSLRESYSCLSELRSFHLALVRIKEGNIPGAIHKEDLIYKSAARCTISCCLICRNH